MTSRIVPLNSGLHGHLRVKHAANFEHAARDQLIPVVIQEFVRVASEFPIVFVKNAKSGQFLAVALMGLQPEENLYCGDEEWSDLYVPLALLNHPFSLALVEEASDKTVVCVNEASDLVDALEGERLFDEDGGQTDYLAERARTLVAYHEKSSVTTQLIDFLVTKDLLVSQDITVQLNMREKHSLNSVYTVDEVRLKKLNDEDFLFLRSKGFLPAIYAQLFSLQNVKNLARRKIAKSTQD